MEAGSEETCESLSECDDPQTLYTGLVSRYKAKSDELEPVKSDLKTPGLTNRPLN